MVGACGSDDCQTLCRDLAFALDECRASWGATWEDLGAGSRTEYRRSCQDTWDTVRADLEARQISAAEDECQDAGAELTELGCDELRALYL